MIKLLMFLLHGIHRLAYAVHDLVYEMSVAAVRRADTETTESDRAFEAAVKRVQQQYASGMEAARDTYTREQEQLARRRGELNQLRQVLRELPSA